MTTDMDRCWGCRKTFGPREGQGYLIGNGVAWACDKACFRRGRRRLRKKLRAKKAALVTG